MPQFFSVKRLCGSPYKTCASALTVQAHMVRERSWWRLTEHVPQGQAPAARVNDDILLINTISTADSLSMVEENNAIIQFLAYDWATVL